jgi:hypothetical protein
VEIKVGVENTPREVALESELTPEQVTAAVETALANGTVLSLTDDRGRTVMIPGSKIAYVEIGAPSARRVGFGS